MVLIFDLGGTTSVSIPRYMGDLPSENWEASLILFLLIDSV